MKTINLNLTISDEAFERFAPMLKELSKDSVGSNLMTLAEVCEKYGYNIWTLRRWIEKDLVKIEQPAGRKGKIYMRHSEAEKLGLAEKKAIKRVGRPKQDNDWF